MNIVPEHTAEVERLHALLARDDAAKPVAALSALLVLTASEAIACVAAKNGMRWSDGYALSSEVMHKTASQLTNAAIHPAELKDLLCGPDSAATRALRTLEGERLRAALISACDKVFDAMRAAGE